MADPNGATATSKPGSEAAPSAAPATQPIVVHTEECSTNLFFTLEGKEHPGEIFNLQFTVRGNPSAAKLRAHFQSVANACGLVCTMGGHAKPVGQQSEAAAPGKSYEFYIGAKGKRFVKLPDGELPKQIKCEIHPGKTMKLNTNARGHWFSHKVDEEWCSAEVPKE